MATTPKPRLTAAAAARRQKRILALRRRGKTWTEIGAEVGISNVHSRRIALAAGWQDPAEDSPRVDYRLVPGVVGLRVGSDGSVQTRMTAGPRPQLGPWRTMTPHLRSGHNVVRLRRDGMRHSVRVAELVLRAWHRIPRSKPIGDIRWIDREDDDRPENLRMS